MSKKKNVKPRGPRGAKAAQPKKTSKPKSRTAKAPNFGSFLQQKYSKEE